MKQYTIIFLLAGVFVGYTSSQAAYMPSTVMHGYRPAEGTIKIISSAFLLQASWAAFQKAKETRKLLDARWAHGRRGLMNLADLQKLEYEVVLWGSVSGISGVGALYLLDSGMRDLGVWPEGDFIMQNSAGKI
jgi:hypothetical protein